VMDGAGAISAPATGASGSTSVMEPSVHSSRT
jgi:hypothetical protein